MIWLIFDNLCLLDNSGFYAGSIPPTRLFKGGFLEEFCILVYFSVYKTEVGDRAALRMQYRAALRMQYRAALRMQYRAALRMQYRA